MAPRSALKILTIGNSFSHSVTVFLPQVVASVPGCELTLEEASHGGCELHRHWKYIECEESDGVFSMYQDRRWKLRELLVKEPWDIVTIQQASHYSWKPETYQPYATKIRDYVLQHAPQAEVVLQQTWAYRSDDPRLLVTGLWGINQEEMYERLADAYRRVAQELGGVRLIPTGLAVQLARRLQPEPFKPYPPSLLKTLRWPDLPPQAGALVGNIGWKKDSETGEMTLWRDTIHLNARGQYLQACMWFAFLYERPVADITFVPEQVGNQDAAFLREVVAKALAEA